MESAINIGSYIDKFRRNKILTSIRPIFFLVVGLFLVYLFVLKTGISFVELFDQLLNIKIISLAYIIAIIYVQILLSSSRWKLIINHLTINKTFTKGFFFYYTCLIDSLSNILINRLFGNFGIKTLALKFKHDVSVIEGSYSVYIEHIFNILVLLLTLFPSILFFLKIISVGYAVVMTLTSIILGLVLINLFFNLFLRLTLFVLSHVVKVLKKFPFSIKTGNLSIKNLEQRNLRVKKYSKQLLIYSIFIYYIHFTSNYFYAYALNIDIPIVAFIISFPLMYFVALFNITPSSLGIREIGWFGILTYIGINNTDASSYVIGCRILTIICYIIILFFSYLFYYWQSLHNENVKHR